MLTDTLSNRICWLQAAAGLSAGQAALAGPQRVLTGIHGPDKIKTTDDSREVKQSSQHLDLCPAKRKGKKTEEGRWGGEEGGIWIRIETLEKAIRRQQIWVLNIYELAALVGFSVS